MHDPILGIEPGGQIPYRKQAIHKPIIKANGQGEESGLCAYFLTDPPQANFAVSNSCATTLVKHIRILLSQELFGLLYYPLNRLVIACNISTLWTITSRVFDNTL
jgi:hypothetical protein